MVRKVLNIRLRQLRQFSTLVIRQVRFPCLKTMMKNNPTLTNALIYGSLYTLAEVSQQTIKNYSSTSSPVRSELMMTSGAGGLDTGSVARYAILGTGVMGPLFSKWYTWIDKAFPGKSKAIVFRKTLLDQFAFTPVCVAVFFVGMAFLEGLRGSGLVDELIEKGPKTFAMDCCFWIPNTAINFLFVPAWLRVTFVSVSSFFWLNILCWIKSWPRQNTAVSAPLAVSKSACVQGTLTQATNTTSSQTQTIL